MADELGIDLGQVRGSGPGGRITKQDIETYLKEREAGSRESSSAAHSDPLVCADDGAVPCGALVADTADYRAAHGREQTAGAALLHYRRSGHGGGDGLREQLNVLLPKASAFG